MGPINHLKHRLKLLIYRLVKPPEKLVYNSYSQTGEDAILAFLFASLRIHTLDYLDIGVCQPDALSNTFAFYQRGCRGVCVEPNPELIAEIRRLRPEDKVLNVGVGDADHSGMSFFVFAEPSLNTFDPEQARAREASGAYPIIKTITVPVRSINSLIAENFASYPTLLSLDAEGLDYAILKALDSAKHPIPVICAETCGYSENHIKPKNSEILALMEQRGYFVYADTYINTIFVRRDWFFRGSRTNHG